MLILSNQTHEIFTVIFSINLRTDIKRKIEKMENKSKKLRRKGGVPSKNFKEKLSKLRKLNIEIENLKALYGNGPFMLSETEFLSKKEATENGHPQLLCILTKEGFVKQSGKFFTRFC